SAIVPASTIDSPDGPLPGSIEQPHRNSIPNKVVNDRKGCEFTSTSSLPGPAVGEPPARGDGTN
ncbi:hypothetical protein, partial [Methylosinus sp. Sm6]|uniref:hypothetical protein n=1 Tax=Methylosinus sp. Sm6 TaxID=2866948 RepID=UPI001C993D98